MRFCSRKVVTYGFILGVLDFTAFWLQTVGLKHTTPGINAFLTATYCVLVPFAWWLIARKRPTAFNIVAAIVAVCGIWLVSVSSSGETLSIGFGEAMTLGCAVAFAAHIVAVVLHPTRRATYHLHACFPRTQIVGVGSCWRRELYRYVG